MSAESSPKSHNELWAQHARRSFLMGALVGGGIMAMVAAGLITWLAGRAR